ncbi:MAG: alpha/beta fold hydrolase [Rhizobiales bacterium]|nr:alpha/beta fold hydrolase [Hyphomicrobiales bacterium]
MRKILISLPILLLVLVFGGLAVNSMAYTKQVEAAFPPLGEFITVDGGRIHYVSEGEAPDGVATIVLIHGASGNLRDMTQTLVPALAPATRVIAFDRPGHGWSERTMLADIPNPAVQARVIHDALAAMGVTKPVILGHSWGGAVATAYALEFPDEISGLLVMSGATHPWPGGVAWYHGVVQTPVIGSFFLHTLLVPIGKPMLEPGVVGNFKPNVPPADYVNKIGLPLLLRPAEFAANSADTSNLKTYLAAQSQRYGEITTPTIIITGNADHTVSPKIHSYALHQQIAGSELIKLKGVGHMPHYADTPVVVDALMRLARGEAVKSGETVIAATP